jgi:hypothetical protein
MHPLSEFLKCNFTGQESFSMVSSVFLKPLRTIADYLRHIYEIPRVRTLFHIQKILCDENIIMISLMMPTTEFEYYISRNPPHGCILHYLKNHTHIRKTVGTSLLGTTTATMELMETAQPMKIGESIDSLPPDVHMPNNSTTIQSMESNTDVLSTSVVNDYAYESKGPMETAERMETVPPDGHMPNNSTSEEPKVTISNTLPTSTVKENDNESKGVEFWVKQMYANATKIASIGDQGRGLPKPIAKSLITHKTDNSYIPCEYTDAINQRTFVRWLGVKEAAIVSIVYFNAVNVNFIIIVYTYISLFFQYC